MTTLLQINASMNNGSGQSSQLARTFVAAFANRKPGTTIVVRDVAAAEPVPHLDAERFGAFITRPDERSIEERHIKIGEVQAMFGDAGKTFRLVPNDLHVDKCTPE